MTAFRFYATFDADSLASYIPPGIPVLLPASSWARDGLKAPNIPSQVTEYAADSGGFIASKIWGEYKYSLAQYVDWLTAWKPGPPQWAAMMDYCCEPELQVKTRERQDRTTANAYQAWQQYKDAAFIWTPTIQGLEPADYQRHASELAPLIAEMQQYYSERSQAAAFRVGIGTLCKRANSMEIRAIVAAIRAVLPDIGLHLWGIKLAAIRALDIEAMGIVSSDSAAWSDKLYNSAAIRSQAAAAGMSIRQYCITVKLPEYAAKVAQAAATPATMPSEERESAIEQIRAAISATGWTPRIRARRAKEYAYAVRRVEGNRLEERYLGPLDNPAHVCALAAALPNTPRSVALPNAQDAEHQAEHTATSAPADQHQPEQPPQPATPDSDRTRRQAEQPPASQANQDQAPDPATDWIEYSRAMLRERQRQAATLWTGNASATRPTNQRQAGASATAPAPAPEASATKTEPERQAGATRTETTAPAPAPEIHSHQADQDQQPQPAPAQRRESSSQHPRLWEGTRVMTPAGLATVNAVRYSDILHRWRCSVLTEKAQSNGSHYAIFDAGEVAPIQQASLFEEATSTTAAPAPAPEPPTTATNQRQAAATAPEPAPGTGATDQAAEIHNEQTPERESAQAPSEKRPAYPAPSYKCHVCNTHNWIWKGYRYRCATCNPKLLTKAQTRPTEQQGAASTTSTGAPAEEPAPAIYEQNPAPQLHPLDLERYTRESLKYQGPHDQARRYWLARWAKQREYKALWFTTHYKYDGYTKHGIPEGIEGWTGFLEKAEQYSVYCAFIAAYTPLPLQHYLEDAQQRGEIKPLTDNLVWKPGQPAHSANQAPTSARPSSPAQDDQATARDTSSTPEQAEQPQTPPDDLMVYSTRTVQRGPHDHARRDWLRKWAAEHQYKPLRFTSYYKQTYRQPVAAFDEKQWKQFLEQAGARDIYYAFIAAYAPQPLQHYIEDAQAREEID
jgi:DNA-directed RNA polymerase subunit RPC12/RpoP